MEHGVGKILRLMARLLQYAPARTEHMAEIGRFAGEPPGMLGIMLQLLAPEIGGIRSVGVGSLYLRHNLIVAHDEGRSTGGGGILQGVAGRTLGGIGADTQGIFHLAGLNETVGHEHGLGAGLAGEFVVGHVDMGTDTEGIDQHGAAGFDRVGVRLGTDVHGADFVGGDTRPLNSVAGGRHGNGDGVLIHPRHGLFLQEQPLAHTFGVATPLTGDGLGLDPVAGHVGAPADDTKH